jgi:ribosomal RNA assembly protein
MLDLVDLDAATRNRNDLRRQKGRLIGEKGRTRQLMEELTGANVVIYGSTLGIIGGPEQVDAVRSAAEMILDGAPHGAVYSFLERRHNEMKTAGLEYHKFPGSERSEGARASMDERSESIGGEASEAGGTGETPE